MHMRLLCLAVFVSLSCFVNAQNPCAARTIKTNQIICVCNATYCDSIAPLGTVDSGQAVLYYSTAGGKRLERSVITSTRQLPDQAIEISIDVREKHQQIFGYGGAFTDAASININTLPQAMQDTLLKQYFSPTAGIGYTFGRIPMASCDFSTHVYSYDDSDGDFQLKNFSLAPEDLTGKIPLILKAQSFTSNSSLKLFGSPWSAPGWMKQNGQMQGGGPLQGDVGGQYYQAFANYFVKFIEAYAQKGVKLWGVTMLNEPTCGAHQGFRYQSMYLSPENERDFAKNLWGPAIRNSQYGKDLKLMILDDNRDVLPDWADTVLADPNASHYVDGIAVHWYEDQDKPASNLLKTHNNHPDKFLLYTEACAGWQEKDSGVTLGSWSRASDYAKSIIDAMNNWVTGWVDWNMALDLGGGPNWVNNFVDSPIIVNKTAVEYYKQPTWYAMGHFSRFVPPGSFHIRTDSSKTNKYIDIASFITPSGQRVVTILNSNTKTAYQLAINEDSNPNYFYVLNIEGGSLATLIIP